MSHRILVSEVPELLEIWDWETNTISPQKISRGSNQKVWWICLNGHESYQQSPHQKTSRSSGMGCPKCNIANRAKKHTDELLAQRGSIADTHSHLIPEWDCTKNSTSPHDILAGSHMKIWWKCQNCGNSFQMTPNSRTTKGYGCPRCSVEKRGLDKRRRLLGRYGSLRESHPLIANEWDYSLNADNPDMVHSGMPDKRWWKCLHGHESYEQAIRDRVRRGYGCPKCQGEVHTSFPEQAIFYYVNNVFPDAINRYKQGGFELDILVESRRIGFEYDGLYWHRRKTERECRKDEHFKELGITVIHIKEYDQKRPMGIESPNVIWIPWHSDGRHIDEALSKVFDVLGITNRDIDIQRDRQKIWARYLSARKQRSLMSTYPTIAEEWDYERNLIEPDMVLPYSNKKVYWVCKCCNNHYEMVIGDRTGKNSGCPLCGINRRNNKQYQVKISNCKRIRSFRRENPSMSIADCARTLELSYPTVKKYWNWDDE